MEDVIPVGFSTVAIPWSFVSGDHEFFILVPPESGSGRGCVNVGQ